MGEGWSDFYAKDFIVGQFPGLDTAAARAGRHGHLHRQRRAHDPRPGARLPASARRPRPARRPGSAGSGGFTYGDFGRIAGEPEVHADGEIWAQTLWDLRAAVGVADARRLSPTACGCRRPSRPSSTCATRSCSPTRPPAGRCGAQIWAVFAQRGMGYFATSEPLQDFSTPPGPGVPRGTITGVVTDAATGQAIAGATAAIGSLADGPDRLAGRAAPTAPTASAACRRARTRTSSSPPPATTARCSR